MSSTGEASESYVPPKIDTSKPSHARVYDLFNGGKDNFEVDRAVYNQISQFAPALPLIVQEQRKWLVRVVRFLAGPAGVDQFLDLGSGLPTAQNTHDVAQQINPDATVVYVDNDPVVIAHGRAVLEENEHTHFVAGDFTDPEKLLSDPTIVAHLEFDRPIGLLMVGIMHLVDDNSRPADFVAKYLERMAPGSYVAIAAMTMPEKDSEHRTLGVKVYQTLSKVIEQLTWRDVDTITAYFGDWEILDPGLTVLNKWWPDGPSVTPMPAEGNLVLGAVGRKR
jgi:hypothetical protein